jgi:hypothetical protein
MWVGCGDGGLRTSDGGGQGMGGSGGAFAATGGAAGTDAQSTPIGSGGVTPWGDARSYDGAGNDSLSDGRALDSAASDGSSDGRALDRAGSDGSSDGRALDRAGSDGSSGDQALDSANEACDTGLLWRAVAFAALSGDCGPDQAGLAYLVLDAEGRVIHNSYYDGNPAGEQSWLDLLGDARWPCLAGETIHYSCFAQ